MPILTQSVQNTDAEADIVINTSVDIANIVRPYKDAGYTGESTYDPSPASIPPPLGTGSYTVQRSWTDLTQAQNCVAEIIAYLNANPGSRDFVTSEPTVIQT